MMRTFVDKMRRLILGPNLASLARMPKADLHQLRAIGSDEQVFFDQTDDHKKVSGATQVDVSSLSVSALKEFEQMRTELAILKERISVLERVNYTSVPKHIVDPSL